MKAKLLTLSPWAGFLVSAISEYGFDVDFPLTPPLWLLIAICVVVGATAHAISLDSNASSQPANPLAVRVFLPDSGLRLTAPTVQRRAWANGRLRNICKTDFSVYDHGLSPVTLSNVIIGADAVLAVIFLGRASIRGPPWGGVQCPGLFDRTPRRPARPFCAALHPSVSRLSSTAPSSIVARLSQLPFAMDAGLVATATLKPQFISEGLQINKIRRKRR